MKDDSSIDQKADLILDEERRFAHQVARLVIDKPRLAVWMILIPVFFVFYFWQLKRYADGLKTFAEKFLLTRKRAVEEVRRAVLAGEKPNAENLVQADDVPAETRSVYRLWVAVLLDHYRDLILAHGGTYPGLVHATYRNRTNYLLFLNRLNQAEREFNASLKPILQPTTEDVHDIIELMEESAAGIRRQRAEEIFP